MPAASMRSRASRRLAWRSPTLEPRERKAWFKAVLEQRILRAAAQLAGNLKIFEGPIGADAAARRSVDESELHQIRLVNLFDRVGLFVNRSSDGVHAHGAAAIFFKQSEHDLLIDLI